MAKAKRQGRSHKNRTPNRRGELQKWLQTFLHGLRERNPVIFGVRQEMHLVRKIEGDGAAFTLVNAIKKIPMVSLPSPKRGSQWERIARQARPC